MGFYNIKRKTAKIGSMVIGTLNQIKYELTMNRKIYMRDVYSKYWATAREQIYGFLEYDKNLCNYICSHVPKPGKLLEVAIGTGYPFGDFFQKAGYSVYGIDISLDLIKRCQVLNSNIICKVGDAEKLDFPDGYFDCTYCFHSTWYIPNLNKAIAEMLRVTRAGGLVIFDIQNLNNNEINYNYCKRLHQKRGLGKIIRYTKNILKLILHKGMPIWDSIVYEVPTRPEGIYKHLEGIGISKYQIMVKTTEETIETRKEPGSLKEFARLIFSINVLNR